MPLSPTHLTKTFCIHGQIQHADLAVAKSLGITLIVNNRPDGEEPGQPLSDELAAAANEIGISFVTIPVGQKNITDDDLERLREAVSQTDGLTLAYCKSGFRSAILRAFAMAQSGYSIDALINEAATANIDLSGYRANLEQIAAT